MNYLEYLEETKKILEKNLKIQKQRNYMFLPVTNKIVRESNIDEEKVCRYQITNVWDDISYKEGKVLFFIDKYINTMLTALEIYKDLLNQKNTFIPANNIFEEATYYFDAMIASFSTLIEGEQKNILLKYFDANSINKIFPSREKVGLYWQVNLIRNRILHFDNGRYSNEDKECRRFYDFSSKINIISTDNSNNISAICNLIDSEKSDIEAAIKIAINSKRKLFDILFPETAAKGYKRKNPAILIIDRKFCFDHISSSISLITNIQNFLGNINHLFLYKIIEGDNIEELKNSKVHVCFNSQEYEYSLKDVFKICNLHKNVV